MSPGCVPVVAVLVEPMFAMPGERLPPRLHRVARIDFWIAIAAITGVLSVGVLTGVAVGVFLSLGWLVYVTATPQMPVLGREPGTNVSRELDEHPGDETVPGIVVLRLDSGLFFAT